MASLDHAPTVLLLFDDSSVCRDYISGLIGTGWRLLLSSSETHLHECLQGIAPDLVVVLSSSSAPAEMTELGRRIKRFPNMKHRPVVLAPVGEQSRESAAIAASVAHVVTIAEAAIVASWGRQYRQGHIGLVGSSSS